MVEMYRLIYSVLNIAIMFYMLERLGLKHGLHTGQRSVGTRMVGASCEAVPSGGRGPRAELAEKQCSPNVADSGGMRLGGARPRHQHLPREFANV